MEHLLITGLDPVSVCRACGILGFAFYMGGFAALQLHWIDATGPAYSLSKILGAALVLVSLTVDFNLSSALIQISFLVIGTSGLYLRLRDRAALNGRNLSDRPDHRFLELSRDAA